MRLTDVSKLRMTDDDEMTSLAERKTAEWAANLSPERVPGAVADEWEDLQRVPSYVESQIQANRALIRMVIVES